MAEHNNPQQLIEWMRDAGWYQLDPEDDLCFSNPDQKKVIYFANWGSVFDFVIKLYSNE